jgi:flagellar biosynthesis/type III secretory pathway protein FliH
MCESIRKFKEDNIRQGKIEGRIEGHMEGRIEGQVELFIEILQYRWEYLSQETIFKLQSINGQQLKELLKHIFKIQNEKELVNVLVSL